MKNKIIHMFQWELSDIKDNLQNIKNSGYTHIQISPVTPTKQPESHEYWLLYQPIDFTIGNNLGSKEELIDLCNAAHDIGLQIIVDVVTRHLAGRDDGSLYPHEKCNIHIANKREYWLDPINASNYWDRYQVCYRCTGTPTLDYNNKELLNTYILPFLDEVLTYADGLRIDEAKHFALEYEGSQFWKIISERYSNKYIYGECLDIDQNLFDDYANYINVLTNSVPHRNKHRAVVFFESHDTFNTFKSTCWMDNQTRLHEYEKLLQQYDSVLFYARPFDDLIFSEDIKRINFNFM